jgi:hypothetical protein
MKTLTRKLGQWLSGDPGNAGRQRWQQLANENGATSQAEWHLSGTRGRVTWRLPSLFADGEANPAEEYLRWEATGLPRPIACEIVPRAQYDDWVVRQSAPGPDEEAGLSKAISVFAETLGFEGGRLATWHPASPNLTVRALGIQALEDFALNWVVMTAGDLTADHLTDDRFQAHWVHASDMLTDTRGRAATDLRLSIADGTARLHTTRAHKNMPLEAVQALIDLGLVLLETLKINGPDTAHAPLDGDTIF